jgi:hypothetical protein
MRQVSVPVRNNGDRFFFGGLAHIRAGSSRLVEKHRAGHPEVFGAGA